MTLYFLSLAVREHAQHIVQQTIRQDAILCVLRHGDRADRFLYVITLILTGTANNLSMTNTSQQINGDALGVTRKWFSLLVCHPKYAKKSNRKMNKLTLSSL